MESNNILSAVGIVLCNKRIVTIDSFKFMTVLSGLHYYVSFFACCILLLLGKFNYMPVNNFDSVIKISTGALASTIFMNLNLASNSVGFYQISKLACIPTTLLLEAYFNVRQQELTGRLLLSLLLIIGGASMFAFNDLSYSSIGLIWAALGVLSTSLAQVLFGPLQKSLKMNALQLLYHTSPMLTLGSFAMIPMFEDYNALMDTTISYGLLRDIMISCLMAVVLNVSNYFVLSQTSPLSYQVIGHVKTCMIIGSGIIFFDKQPPDAATVATLCVVMIGVMLYTLENNRQRNAKQGEISPQNDVLASALQATLKASRATDNDVTDNSV